MRKVLIIVCMVMLVAVGSLTGAGMESLYPLVVPYEYTELNVAGGLFPDAVKINLDLSPFNFDADVGGAGNYQYEQQTAVDFLDLNANASLRLGTTSITTTLSGDGTYKSYSLNLNEMPGFYTAGGSIFFMPTFVGGATNIQLELEAFGGVGLGRIYNITTIRLIELMMKHLGITPTEENVKAAAEIIYTNRYRLNKYTDDTSKNYIEYYRALAAAMGAPEKILELIYIGQSQRYAFERNRYNNLKFGWELQAGAGLAIDIATSTDFAFYVEVLGQLANFLMENKLHYDLNGRVEFGFDSGAVTKLGLSVNALGRATYLPDDPQWWATGSAEITFNTRANPILDVELLGTGFYQLEPNLTLYAGVGITSLFTQYSIKAGGNYRVW